MDDQTYTTAAIWKVPLPPVGAGLQRLDVAAEVIQVVSVGPDPTGLPCAWLAVRPDGEPSGIDCALAGTGHEIPAWWLPHYVGHVIRGPFVWHVFAGVDMGVVSGG